MTKPQHPSNNTKQQPSVLAAQQVFQYTSSPLPASSEFLGYENTLNGAANRILEMVEKEQAHRINVEKLTCENTIENNNKIHEHNMALIKHEYLQKLIGTISGFIISVLIVVIGGLLIYKGHDWAGAGIVTGTLVSMAGVFVLGKFKKTET